MLLMNGKGDQMTLTHISKNYLNKQKIKDLSIKEFELGKHNMGYDDEEDEILKYSSEWMLSKLKQAPKFDRLTDLQFQIPKNYFRLKFYVVLFILFLVINFLYILFLRAVL